MGPQQTIVVDLSGVEFVDSSSLSHARRPLTAGVWGRQSGRSRSWLRCRVVR
jgi:hypothetical protein